MKEDIKYQAQKIVYECERTERLEAIKLKLNNQELRHNRIEFVTGQSYSTTIYLNFDDLHDLAQKEIIEFIKLQVEKSL